VPRTAGWLSHEDGTRFLFAGPDELRYDRPIKQTLQMLEGGSASTLGFAALDAAVDPLLSLTPAAILAHLGRYHDALEPGVVARGFRSYRAPRAAGRSGILSFQPPAGISAANVVTQLRERGVFASMPDGLLRLAPHFPNALSETETVLAALDEALAALRLD
jgi:selenocysteine lyase/cysteine desulfurase